MKGFLGEFGGFLGLILIVTAILLFDEKTPYPSVYTLAPVLGAGLIILCATPASLVGKFLSYKVFVGAGLISYSAYLWHYPLFAFAAIGAIDDPIFGLVFTKLVLVLVTFILAYITYRIVETPFRNKKIITSKQIVLIMTLSAVFLLMLGFYGKATKGLADQYYQSIHPANRYLLINKDELIQERHKFWSASRRGSVQEPFETNDKLKLLVLGDSHGQDLTAAFEHNSSYFYSNYQVRRLTFTERCLAKLPQIEDDRECNRYAADYIGSTLPDNSDYIILSARWSFDSITYLPKVKAWLNKNSNKVVFMGRTAEFTDTADLARQLANSNEIITSEAADMFLAGQRNIELDSLNDKLQLITNQLEWPFIDRLNLGCDIANARCAFFNEHGKSYYSDYGHWTDAGAEYFGQKVFQAGWFKNLKKSSVLPVPNSTKSSE